MSKKITLRNERADDEAFLFSVYSSTRSDEVAQFGWDEAQAVAFLRMQFAARERAYKMQFPAAGHSIILFGTLAAGRLITDRTGKHITLTDIAVLPEYQKNGIATYILSQLQQEAGESGRPLVLRVDKTNIAAKEFYEKLGFAIRGETEGRCIVLLNCRVLIVCEVGSRQRSIRNFKR